MNKQARMEAVFSEVSSLPHSELVDFRKSNNYVPVIGEGSLDAKILFIGEAPGKNEAMSGKPFCGRSGKVLDELLSSIGLTREEVYIANIVKDRPPENRDPTEKEIALYARFLDEQIAIIEPKIISTLGRIPMKYIFEKFGIGDKLQSIGDLHGSIHEVHASFGSARVIPLYHPAVAVYNSRKLPVLKDDFTVLKNAI